MRPVSILAFEDKQPHDRERRDALARAALADDAQRAALLEAERHIIDRLHDAFFGVEVGAEVVDFEDGWAWQVI